MIRLIARREVRTRLQQKGFRIGLAVALLLIAVIALLPKVVGGSQTRFQVGLAGADSQTLGQAVIALASDRGAKVTVHTGVDPATAAKNVADGRWDAVVVDNARIVARSATSDAALLLQAAYQSVTSVQRLRASGLDAAKVQRALDVPALPVEARTSDTNKRQAIATLTVIVLFGQLITFCSWVATGVVEEKSSRIVELVLSSVRPWQLLAGKLLGIGLIAFGQLVAFAVIGFGVVRASGSIDLPSGTFTAVVLSVLWFVLAFAFFAGLAAALASLVSRQEEVAGVLTPVTGLLTVSYLLGLAVTNAPDTSLARVLSIVPPVSAMAMPGRILRGDVPPEQVALAVILMLAVTLAVVAIGARIYRAAILHAGSRVSLRRAWRGEAAVDPN